MTEKVKGLRSGTDLSIIIINYKTDELVKECVASVKKFTRNLDYEIIVIDNSKENLGFAKGNNLGASRAKGKYLLFLNSDTLVHDNVLGEMVEWLDKNPDIGAASCRLKNKNGTVQESGGYFPNLLRVFSWMTIQDFPLVDKFVKPFHPHKEKSFIKNDEFWQREREMDWVKGAFLMMPKKVFNEAEGWDSDYFMYTEDTDVCFKVKEAGYKVIYNPKWSITHLGGRSSTAGFAILSEFESVKLFYKKHYPKWQMLVLVTLFKVGSLGRMILFYMLGKKELAKIYAKAFRTI